MVLEAFLISAKLRSDIGDKNIVLLEDSYRGTIKGDAVEKRHIR